MSEENVEIVRQIYAEWGRGNFREGAALYDPHVLLVVRPEFGLASGEGVYCGPDEVARYMREVFLPEWEGLAIAGDEFLDAGDSVVVHVDQRGTVGKAARTASCGTSRLDLSRNIGDPHRERHGASRSPRSRRAS